MRLEMVRAADITAWASAGILSRETRAVGPEFHYAKYRSYMLKYGDSPVYAVGRLGSSLARPIWFFAV
jgi:hypothetical protein